MSSSLSHSLLGEAAPGGKATILSCLLNLSSTCMGTGLLSLPFAFSQSGFAAGCLLCVAAAGTCGASLFMLVDSGRKLRMDGKPVSLGSVCEAALPGMGVAIDVAVIGNCLGTAASSNPNPNPNPSPSPSPSPNPNPNQAPPRTRTASACTTGLFS